MNDEQQDQLKILLKLQNQLEMTNFENEKLNLKKYTYMNLKFKSNKNKLKY